MKPSSHASSRRHETLPVDRRSRPAPAVVAGVVVLIALVYWPVAGYEFVNFDDDVHVYQNQFVRTGLTARNAAWAFGIHGPSQWHPLAWLSHQLDCELYGLDAGAHHLTNVVLHTLAAVLLFLALDRMTGAFWPAALAAALFAVHPINVESVAWVSERRNVLSAVFCMLTLLAYTAYSRRGGTGRYMLVAAFFALGLMAKPMLVTLPCGLLLLDVWPLRRSRFLAREELADGIDDSLPAAGPQRSLGFLVLEKLPLLTLSAISSVLTVLCQQSEQIVAGLDALPLNVRILNALVAYGAYLRKLIWPTDLGVFYPHPGFIDSDPLAVLLVPALLSAALLIAITGWTLWTFRRRPYLAVGWLWFLGTLVPMIGLVQSGQQQMADRYTYLAQIGLFLAVVWFVRSLERRPGRLLRIGGAVAVALSAGFAWWQVGYWQNSIMLFEHTAAVTRRNHWAHNNWGLALYERGRVAEAMQQYRRALHYVPDYALAHYNLGVVLHDQGRVTEAIDHFREALRLRPDDAQAHIRMGAAVGHQGDLESAVAHFRQALYFRPNDTMAHYNLGLALARLGRSQESLAAFREVVKRQPDDARTHFTIGVILRDSGALTEAHRSLVRARELSPQAAEIHNALGELQMQLGEKDQAIMSFRTAVALRPDFSQARQNLETALAE